MGQHCWRRVGWWQGATFNPTEGRNQIFEATQLPRINENLKGQQEFEDRQLNSGIEADTRGLKQWRVGLMPMLSDTLARSVGHPLIILQWGPYYAAPARRIHDSKGRVSCKDVVDGKPGYYDPQRNVRKGKIHVEPYVKPEKKTVDDGRSRVRNGGNEGNR